MIKIIKLYVNKCTFMLPFMLGAIMCALWGGLFNLLTFLFIGFVGIKILERMSRPKPVAEV